MGGTHFLQTGYLLLNRNAPFQSCNNGYLQLFLKVIFMKIETQHILVHIIYPVNIPKVRHLIISTPYYRFSEYLRCSSIP